MKTAKISPAGFCFGVQRAIKILDEEIKNNPDKNIYCIHQIVHNPKVLEYFEKKGVKFVENISQVPENQKTIICFSAHGINKKLLQESKKKNYFKVVNLECPLVTKVYKQIDKFLEEKRIIFYIGKVGHVEAENIKKHVKDKGGKIFIIKDKNDIPKINKQSKIGIANQTTLNYQKVKEIIQEIKNIYPNATALSDSDICKATFERQNALIKTIKSGLEAIIVIGGKNSSNTKELVKIGEKHKIPTFHIEKSEEIKNILPKIQNYKKIGITAGASTNPQEIEIVENFLKNENFDIEK